MGWDAIAPLIPPGPPKPKGGAPRGPDRAVLSGIIFVLRTGLPWQMLPGEMGCGSGSTCRRRLRDWQAAGVWERPHHALLARLGRADIGHWGRARVGSASIPDQKEGHKPARIRRIARNRARSAVVWSTAPASARSSARPN